MEQEETIGLDAFQAVFHKARQEICRVVVGQERVVEHLLTGVFAGGNVLLKGMPGLGRTLLVKTLARVLGLEFRRIQFTPDLLPTDIIGTEVLEYHPATGDRGFRFFKGPVFANLVLADEINRSPARTQSTLLEVMQERQVTVGGQTHFLPRPFLIVATQNSQDTEGVFHLGEAQVDRFLMMIEQEYPGAADEKRMVLQTTSGESMTVATVTGPKTIMAMQRVAREVPVVPSVQAFALTLVRGSRPGEADAIADVHGMIRLGASPRAAQSLLLAAKVAALAHGRRHVTQQDIIDVAEPVMHHRLLLDHRVLAEGTAHRRVMAALVAHAREHARPRVSRWTGEIIKVVSR